MGVEWESCANAKIKRFAAEKAQGAVCRIPVLL